jgi:hypothetical protein
MVQMAGRDRLSSATTKLALGSNACMIAIFFVVEITYQMA